MGALEYGFRGNGTIFVLDARLRSGWSDGRYGPYFLGVCVFDWRFGTRCRAQVRVNPCTPFRLLDEQEWSDFDEPNHARWTLSKGTLTAEMAIFYNDAQGNLQVNPRFGSSGMRKARLDHAVACNTFRADLNVFMTFDRDRPDLVEWAKGSGMASGGLPSLGKRR